MENEVKFILNGKEVTGTQLNEVKSTLKKGMQLVEVSPGTFKTRLQD